MHAKPEDSHDHRAPTQGMAATAVRFIRSQFGQTVQSHEGILALPSALRLALQDRGDVACPTPLAYFAPLRP